MPIPDAVAGPEPLDAIDPDAARVQAICNRALRGLIEATSDDERGRTIEKYDRELREIGIKGDDQ